MAYLSYRFGCLPPTSGRAEALVAQRARNDLWNRLVEIERARRELADLDASQAQCSSQEPYV